jgi:hypothetical protein
MINGAAQPIGANQLANTKAVVVYMPSHYKEKGVIFDKDYIIGIDMVNLKHRYTPTIDDVTKTEEIFNNKYNELQGKNVDVKKFFRCWVRQYVGLTDSSGNRNIIVQLIENKKPQKINKLLGKNWETDFVIYFSDPHPSLGILFRINIDTGQMTTQL